MNTKITTLPASILVYIKVTILLTLNLMSVVNQIGPM